MSEQRGHAEETSVRQGRTGTGLRWVLRISLALIVVAMAAIWLSYSGRSHEELPAQMASTSLNRDAGAAATAPAEPPTAQFAGRKEQTSGG